MPGRKEAWGKKDRRYRAARARLQFLRKVQKYYPDVVQNLEISVLPKVELGTAEAPIRRPRGEGVEKALQEWGERWSLSDDWVLTKARDLLVNLANEEVTPSDSEFELGFGLIGLDPPKVERDRQKVEISPPIYVLYQESRKDYLVRVNEYADAVEQVYDEAGWEETTQQPEQEMHIGWLVRHDVGGESIRQIARSPLWPKQAGREERTEKQVEGALKRMRDLTGKIEPRG